MSHHEFADASALFVYYRVPAATRGAALAALQGMQSHLQTAWPGLKVRLMRRTDQAEGASAEQTWMEVYEHPDGLGAAFAARLQSAAGALPADLIGPRHTESFSDVPRPAGTQN